MSGRLSVCVCVFLIWVHLQMCVYVCRGQMLVVSQEPSMFFIQTESLTGHELTRRLGWLTSSTRRLSVTTSQILHYKKAPLKQQALYRLSYRPSSLPYLSHNIFLTATLPEALPVSWCVGLWGVVGARHRTQLPKVCFVPCPLSSGPNQSSISWSQHSFCSCSRTAQTSNASTGG